jgi:hypothetical protein
MVTGVFGVAFGSFAVSFLLAFLICFLVAGSIVLPGARYRKPVSFTVSKAGIATDAASIPLNAIGAFSIECAGVRISDEPIIPILNTSPTATRVGRSMGEKQAARSYVVKMSVNGKGASHILAGGLTEHCAQALTQDLTATVSSLRP